MGISGLLPFLESISKKSHISEFKGSVVAIDAYCWLHKGAFSCSDKLARGEPTNAHINYCMKYVNMLLNFNIIPILVFDGQHLAAKKETELKRREDRTTAKKKAFQLIALGRAYEARQYLQRCVDITHEMALQLIKACRTIKVDCIVAPFEADAQLAFFSIKDIVDYIITEDSDMLLFGCKKTLFKLTLDGSCTLVDQDKLCVAMQMSPDVYTFDKFRYMCILSGCDYLKSLPGIGLKRAYKAFKHTHNSDIVSILSRLRNYLNNPNLVVDEEYIKNFLIADATFRHQIIFNPLTRKLEYLTDPENCGTKQEYLCNAGSFLNDDLAFQMALGNIDPFTKKVLDDWSPENENCRAYSIWSNCYRKKAQKREQAEEQNSEKTVSMKVTELSVEDDLKDKMLYDMKLQKELDAYKIPLPKKQKFNESLKVNVESNLKSENPFIRKREKLNKFNTTTTMTKSEIIRSKFFAPKTIENDFNADGEAELTSPTLSYRKNLNIKIDSESLENEFVSVTKLEKITESNKIAGNDSAINSKHYLFKQFEKPVKTKLTVEVDDFSDIENLTPPEFFQNEDSIFKKELNKLTLGKIIIENRSANSSQESPCSSQTSNTSLECKLTKEVKNSVSLVKNGSKTSLPQSSWFQRCRRVGLSKTKSHNGHQQTLISMFKKLESKD